MNGTAKDPSAEPGPRRRGGKWRIVALFWLAQGVFFAWFGAMWFYQAGTVDGTQGRPLGRWNPLAVFDGRHWISRDALIFIAMPLGITMLLQAVMVWPVRRPRPRLVRGWSLWWSIAATGVCASLLSLALVFALSSAVELSGVKIDWPFGNAEEQILLAAWFVTVWLAATPLLWKFANRRLNAGEGHEDVLGRIASRLFMGTLVEAAAIMPIDVMVRRKTDCYSFSNSFFAMTICLGVGIVALGPAVVLVALGRRRKEWYAGRCGACGYDLSGLLTPGRVVERCPECGAGWRTRAPAPNPANPLSPLPPHHSPRAEPPDPPPA